MQPFHIAFEGIDGCGKDEQIDRLQSFLAARKIPSKRVEDPGAGNSRPIRELLLNKRYSLTTMQQLLLFTAARVAAVAEVRSLLERGICAISSRWVLSTQVYQGVVGGLGQPLVNGLHTLCVAHDPHLTILLDLPATVAQRRIGQRDLQRRPGGRYHASKQDRFESQGLRFAKQLRRGYLKVAAQLTNCVVVNGNATPDKVAGRVLQVCEGWIPEFEQLLKDA